jgi:SOS-response transcriptional repressor LexA
MTPLAYRQCRDTWEYLSDCAMRGYCPSYREIMEEVGISSPSMTWLRLTQLASRGYVRMSEGRSHAIQVLLHLDKIKRTEA